MPRKATAAPKTLSAASLEPLGAARLAALLMELAAADPAVQRRLKLELAATRSPADLAREIAKRLQSVARGRTYLERPALRALLAELDGHRRAAAERIASAHPAAAVDLLWQMLDLAEGLHHRGDDSNGEIGAALGQVLETLGQVAAAAPPDPAGLAARVFLALQDNGYGQYDRLVTIMAPALGPAGLDDLERRLRALREAPAPEGERRVIGFGPGGPVHEDPMRERELTVRIALQEIADARGDVDAYAAQYSAEQRRLPRIATDIAQRLLAAGRAAEALDLLDAAGHPPVPGRRALFDPEYESARIAALDALGRGAEAQAARWSAFERTLWPEPLRDYLKRLPDFDDVEAETRALDHVQAHPAYPAALHFLVAWPALDRAAALVLARPAELDGDMYELLTPAAAALSGRHPLAATLALRAMVDFTLGKARSSRYGHAARHLLECESLAATIGDWGAVPPHAAYLAGLKAAHARKSGFWSQLP